MKSNLQFTTSGGVRYQLPLFMPVYQPKSHAFQLSTQDPQLKIEGLIVNAFFLYKQRNIRETLTTEKSLSEFVGFDGLIATDSGAFQGLSRQLYLANKDIVRFQDRIGSDVIAPLDLITPPWDKRKTAEKKLAATNKRIQEALNIAERGMVAGVQQGGRYMDLRRASTDALMEMGVHYVAIGSLVPFFNRNHDLSFAGEVIREARRTIGPDLPMHIYGAGDPVELPFFFALGATIFDSASYAHYGKGGYYMTPYGAVKDPSPFIESEYRCDCRVCENAENIEAVFKDEDLLIQHNLCTILKTISRLRELSSIPGGLNAYLSEILEVHTAWFPDSKLSPSWEELHQ